MLKWSEKDKCVDVLAKIIELAEQPNCDQQDIQDMVLGVASVLKALLEKSLFMSVQTGDKR